MQFLEGVEMMQALKDAPSTTGTTEDDNVAWFLELGQQTWLGTIEMGKQYPSHMHLSNCHENI